MSEMENNVVKPQARSESLSSTTSGDTPQQWFVCDECDGTGEVPTGRMSHSVCSATIDPPWEIMDRCSKCDGAGGWMDDAEADEERANQ